MVFEHQKKNKIKKQSPIFCHATVFSFLNRLIWNFLISIYQQEIVKCLKTEIRDFLIIFNSLRLPWNALQYFHHKMLLRLKLFALETYDNSQFK